MAFEPEDGDLFFGREEVVATTVGQILAGGFMAVVGASGSGKSSLVRAGLVPAFRRARDGSVAVMTPGSDPAAELRRSLGARSAVAPRRRPARGGVHALSGRRGPSAASSTPLIDLREAGSTVDRGHPPRGLLRAMRRASSPGRGAGRAPAPARADADATSCAGRSRAPPARRDFDSRPAWSTRCWPTSKASPAPSRSSPTPSTSRGPAATVGS